MADEIRKRGTSATASAAWADALLLSFAQAGYVRAEPAILQPAEPFLDLSGEDIRKSLYLTTDASGEELCLRPDLTIPVARNYLASPRAGPPGNDRVRADRGRNSHRRRGAVHCADRCPRALPGVAAAADQGFQPQDQSGTGSRTAHARDPIEPQRI